MKFYYRDKLPWKQYLIIAIITMIIWYGGYLVAGNSPEFQEPVIISREQGAVYPRPCDNPCIAFNMDEAFFCGQQSARDDMVHAGEVCE